MQVMEYTMLLHRKLTSPLHNMQQTYIVARRIRAANEKFAVYLWLAFYIWNTLAMYRSNEASIFEPLLYHDEARKIRNDFREDCAWISRIKNRTYDRYRTADNNSMDILKVSSWLIFRQSACLITSISMRKILVMRALYIPYSFQSWNALIKMNRPTHLLV